jgi:hypothetical protein
MKKSFGLVLSSIVLVGALTGCGAEKASQVDSNTLVSAKTMSSISIDGAIDSAWEKATAVEVDVNKLPYQPNNGYPGMTETTVTLKSLYDNENVYFLVQYNDATKSLERFPWVKQADGTWKQKMAKDNTGHDNTYYEDKFAIFWNINAAGFAKKGCAIACHMSENGMTNGIKDKSAGRKFTNAGETIDMWHWKGVRSNPVGQVDDQFVDSDGPDTNKNWGRHGDVKTGGGYKNNTTKDKSKPMYMNSKMTDENKYYVHPDLKTKFVDTFKTGDVIPGITLSPFSGPRADISAKGVWKDGVWTIEMKRKLVTTGDKSNIQDVQFSDLGKSYNFGVSVFDNSQINHVYHDEVLSFVFKK